MITAITRGGLETYGAVSRKWGVLMRLLKTAHYFSAIGVLLLVTLTVTAVTVATSPWSLLSGNPPPSPTSGPPPTPEPGTASRGSPVMNREEAIRQALYYDSLWAIRRESLTEESIATNPDMIVVEPYATRQEASDMYWGDRFPDPKIASEPVWVVIIKGKVSVRIGGGLGTMPEYVEADGVTYEFSQVDGKLLRVVAAIARKRTEKSP